MVSLKGDTVHLLIHSENDGKWIFIGLDVQIYYFLYASLLNFHYGCFPATSFIPCPLGWYYIATSGSCYLLVNEGNTYTWEEGMRYCKEIANSSLSSLLYFDDDLEAKIILLEYFHNENTINWIGGKYSSGNIPI